MRLQMTLTALFFQVNICHKQRRCFIGTRVFFRISTEKYSKLIIYYLDMNLKLYGKIIINLYIVQPLNMVMIT